MTRQIRANHGLEPEATAGVKEAAEEAPLRGLQLPKLEEETPAEIQTMGQTLEEQRRQLDEQLRTGEITEEKYEGILDLMEAWELEQEAAGEVKYSYSGELPPNVQNDALDISIDKDYNSIGKSYIRDIIRKSIGLKWNNGSLIQLSKAEYAAVTSRISTQYMDMKHHGGVQYVELSTDGKNAKFYLYLFVDHGFGDYEIIARLDYARQDALIEELRRMIQNGRKAERVSASTSGLRTIYGNAARGRNNYSSRRIKNLAGRTDNPSGGQRERDNGQLGASDSNESYEGINSGDITSREDSQFSISKIVGMISSDSLGHEMTPEQQDFFLDPQSD